MKKLYDYRIKIFTRSLNYELYCYSQHLITLPFERVRLTHTTADGYLYQILEDKDCDIAINIDEDAFVYNESAILNLVEFMIDNEYANAGMADGGEVVVRGQNPIVTNPFFNILNLKLIRTKFSKNNVINFNYIQHKYELIQNLPDHLRLSNDHYNVTDFEPYYSFFFWLSYHFKTLYLPAKTHSDGITTILMNQNHTPMLYHTWFARSFRQPENLSNTTRILNVINYVSDKRNITVRLSFCEQISLLFIRAKKNTSKLIKKIMRNN